MFTRHGTDVFEAGNCCATVWYDVDAARAVAAANQADETDGWEYRVAANEQEDRAVVEVRDSTGIIVGWL